MVAVLTASPTRSKVRPHVGTASSRRYERRRPEKTPLYKVVAEHLEGWLENRAVAEQPVSAHIERELRSYLTCGILCFGFGRARCASCGQGFVVASRLSRVRQPWEPLAFPSAARQDGAMDGPHCLWLAARAAVSVPPAMAAGWHRQLRISSTASFPRCPCGSG